MRTDGVVVNKRKSWQIIDGKLPVDLVEHLRRVVQQHNEWRDSLPNPLEPPWALFPTYERGSMGWRMGAGEDYMLHFRLWYVALDAQAQADYQMAEPEPEGWRGFYDSLRK